MRKLSLVCLMAGLFVLAGAGSALATTVNLIWTGSSDAAATGVGTSAISVSGSTPTTLTLDIVIGVDAAGLSAAEFDLQFDTDLGNELNIVSFQELSWANAKATRTLTQITGGILKSQESTAALEGQIFSLEAFTLTQGAQNVTLTFARVVFSTNAAAVTSDGSDVFGTKERDAGLGGFDNVGDAIAFQPSELPEAAVNLLPEPQSMAMLAMAVGSLVAAGWRRR